MKNINGKKIAYYFSVKGGDPVKKFSCSCIDEQFARPDQVFVGFDEKSGSSILCAYRPKGKVTLRSIKLDVNYCPRCGAKLEDV